MLDNKILLMKISKLQAEISKLSSQPTEKEKFDSLLLELEEKNAAIKQLQAELEQAKQENLELKDSVQFQKYLVEEKVEIIKKEQQKVKDVRNSTRSQNAIIGKIDLVPDGTCDFRPTQAEDCRA